MRFKILQNFLKTAKYALALGLASCAFKSAVLRPPPARPVPEIRDRYAIFLLIDGARPEDIDAGVAAGRLPNFKKLFYEEGARFENALTVFPTVSQPAHQALLSGLYPGHHALPSLSWFSRASEKSFDFIQPKGIPFTNTYLFNFLQIPNDQIVTDEPQLIFTTLRGQNTLSVYEPVNQGATVDLPKHLPAITAFTSKYGGFPEEVDVAATRSALRELGNTKKPFPRFTVVTCFGMDVLTHYTGLGSRRTQDLYILYDRFLGDLLELLEKRGIRDKTLLVVSSDHGQHEVKESVNLAEVLVQMGLKIDASPQKSQVMFGRRAIAFSNLYFKVGENWQQKPSYADLKNYSLKNGKKIDLIESLLEHPRIEWVLAPEGPWRLHVHRDRQHAVIEQRRENGKFLYAYRPDPGQDPLDYLGIPEIQRWVRESRFVDAETWLQATANLPIPDAPPVFTQLFDDYQVGEMAIVTTKSSEFHGGHISGHGSPWREDRRVPLLFHGPGIQPGVYPRARSVDLFPTLMDFFGLDPQVPVDGIARRQIFRAQALGDAADPPPSPSLSVSAFEEELKEQIEKKKLSGFKKDKAEQMLYTIREYRRDHAQYAEPGRKAGKTKLSWEANRNQRRSTIKNPTQFR
ncbi:MAG TPA: hypothetical protein DF383_04190 [Deltaproteobacteria bacterium]|nr:hypothetical protein [Deltaproteobacteria bacterium]